MLFQSKIKKSLKNGVRFPEKEVWKVAYQCLEGLNKLHESNIIHRDIKTANIFFHNGNVKVGDLNVAKQLKDSFTVTQTGTPYYASPEVWNEEPYNYKSDIWSLGCILYEMVMLRPPFRAENAEGLYKKVMAGNYDKISAIYTKKLADFIGQCLTVKQSQRPSTKELLCLPVMLDLQEGDVFDAEEDEDPMMNTIKLPNNIKSLNSNLPKPKYEKEKLKSSKKINFELPKNESLKKIPMPSLKNIRSEKLLPGLNDVTTGSKKHIGGHKIGAVAKPKALMKIASQKLLF